MAGSTKIDGGPRSAACCARVPWVCYWVFDSVSQLNGIGLELKGTCTFRRSLRIMQTALAGGETLLCTSVGVGLHLSCSKACQNEK